MYQDRLVVSFATFQTMVTRFGPKVGETGPKWDKSVYFRSEFSTFWLKSDIPVKKKLTTSKNTVLINNSLFFNIYVQQ